MVEEVPQMADRPWHPDVGSVITSILVVLVLLVPALAAADGMAFTYGPSRLGPASSLKPLEVNEQRATIAHKDGIQRTFIAINLGDPSTAKEASRAAVWIFPVPGSPDRADVNVTDFVPKLKGDDVEQAVTDVMDKARWIPLATQPHVLPFLAVERVLRRMPHGVYMGMLGRAEGSPGVAVHKEVERWGIHAELITADSVESISDYLRKKEVNVGEETFSSFAPHLSNKYSLVVAWITSYEDLIKKFPQYAQKQGTEWASLYVEFPTDKPFYPMRPTSGYGKKPIAVSLYTVGWLKLDTTSWTPSEKKAMSPRTRYYAGKKEEIDRAYRKDHLRQKGNAGGPDQEFSGTQLKTAERFLEAVPEGEVSFTRIWLNTSAENFTQDLWLSPNSRVYVIHFIASSWWMTAAIVILLLVAFSYISGGTSGAILFRAWRPWARIGLWNCLTIVAVVIVTWLVRRDPKSADKATTASHPWEALFFGGLSAVVLVPISLIIASHLLSETRWPSWSPLPLLLIGFIPLLLLITAWVVSQPRVVISKTDDRLPESQMRVILRTILKSFSYVLLVCTPSVLLIVAYGMLGGAVLSDGHSYRLTNIYILGIVSVGLMILVLSALITVALFIVLWIARKIGSVWRVQEQIGLEHTGSVTQGRRSVIIVFGILTCVVGTVLVMSIALSRPLEVWHLFISRIALFTLELVITTWIVWKGASARTSRAAGGSPAGMFGIPVMIAGAAACVVVVYSTARLLGLNLVYLADRYLSIPYGSLFVTMIIIGGAIAVTLIGSKRIRDIARNMDFRTALSTMFVILSTLSYLALFTYLGFFTGITWREEMIIGSMLSIWALFLATWLVKGELNEKPTKALRFGVLFSVIFMALNLATFVGLKALVASVFS